MNNASLALMKRINMYVCVKRNVLFCNFFRIPPTLTAYGIIVCPPTHLFSTHAKRVGEGLGSPLVKVGAVV